MDELRLLVRSMMERLFGLLSSERFASDMSAVTLVIATLASHAPHAHMGKLLRKSMGGHMARAKR